MNFKNLLYSVKDSTAAITLNRPEVLNALDAESMNELDEAVQAAGKDDAVRGVIVTGAGDKAFAAGADLNQLAKETPLGAGEFSRRGQGVFGRIEFLGKPVVAALNGYALGGGCELALACTARIASENAVLGLPEVSLGIIPGYGGTQRLARLVGKGRALELILTGRKISADEALRIGLVNKVVPQSELLGAAKILLEEILKNPPLAVRLAMQAVHEGLDMPLEEGLAHEAALFGLSAASEDAREGLNAFLEKRKPRFTGK